MLPNFGTYGPAVVIGAMINKGGIGYGMTRYGWIADMVLGLEVILANGETIRLGALANQGTTFGPFQKWIHLPDLLGLFTLAAGSMGIISKVCLRAIEAKREWLHDYCYSFRRDQLQQVQDALIELVKGEVAFTTSILPIAGSITGRWKRGFTTRSKVPDDGWFFLKTVLMARDDDELAFKEKRMRRSLSRSRRRRRAGDRRQSDGSQSAGTSACTAGPIGMSWDRTAGAARSCATPACSRSRRKCTR